MKTESISLAGLVPGGRGRIVAVTGEDSVTVRLLELGLLPGEPLEVLGVAPFGDPVAVQVRGTRLAIRRCDAARIQILTADNVAASGPVHARREPERARP